MAVKEVKEEIANPEALVLENRKIKIRPIRRDRAFFKKDHDGNHTFSGCWRYYTLPMSLKTGGFFDPFKNKNEQRAFEQLLNLQPGDLGINNRDPKKNMFWGSFVIKIDNNGLDLDLSNVLHALQYRVLSVNPTFAKQGDDLSMIEYEYQIIDERYEDEENSKLYNKKKEAYAELSKLSDSKQKMIDTLRVLGTRLSDTVKKDTAENELIKIIEQVDRVPGLKIKNIDDFLEAVKDTSAPMKIFVLDAMDKGEVIFRKGEYRLAQDDTLIGRSLQGAVDWFNDIKNQEFKILVQERLKH
jgi:hypothetical protein